MACKQCEQEQLNKHGVAANSYVEVKLICAENLKPLDFDGTSDPYVVFELDGQSSQSTIKPNTLNPTWNETFTFAVTKLDTFLYVKIFDKDRFGSDDLEGVMRINLMDLREQVSHEDFYNIYQEDYVTLERGQLRLQLLLVYSRKQFNETKLKKVDSFIEDHENQLTELNKYRVSLTQPFGLILNGNVIELVENEIAKKKIETHRLTAAFKPRKAKDDNLADRLNNIISGTIS